MAITVKEFYDAIGGNYNDALKRLMKDALVMRFAQKFEKDPSFAQLKDSLDAGSTEEAFRAAHTLKGVSANLAFAKLQSSASEITEMLRAGNLESAKAYFPHVEADYARVIEQLKRMA